MKTLPKTKPVAAKPPLPPVPTFEHPKTVRGIYLTAWTAGSRSKLSKMLDLLDRTELNSVVIDIRDDGEVYFPIDDPLVKRVQEFEKAQNKKHHQGDVVIAVTKPARLMETLAKRGAYPIARIACFRDHYLPVMDPDRAVQAPGGKTWRDRKGYSWLDPYDKRNWEYLAKIVNYAMDLGFPEIQLDYVRFPSEGKSSTQIFPNKAKYDDPKAHPDDVITAFAHWMGERVRKRGRAFSADVFGIISSGKVDQGIGQTLEKIAAPFDVLSPMVYPSHFAKGEYKIPDPNRSPGAIITKSLGDYKKRIPKTPIRPWLQDFSLGYPYGAKEVRAQIDAAHALGYNEFLLWNAGNRYTEGALKKEKAESKVNVAAASAQPPKAPTAKS